MPLKKKKKLSLLGCQIWRQLSHTGVVDKNSSHCSLDAIWPKCTHTHTYIHNKAVKSHGDTNKWSLLNDTGAINKVTLRTRNHVEAVLECDCSPFGYGFLKFWRAAERANPAMEIRVLFELKKCCVNRARKILLALRSHRRRKRVFFLSRFFLDVMNIYSE